MQPWNPQKRQFSSAASNWQRSALPISPDVSSYFDSPGNQDCWVKCQAFEKIKKKKNREEALTKMHGVL